MTNEDYCWLFEVGIIAMISSYFLALAVQPVNLEMASFARFGLTAAAIHLCRWVSLKQSKGALCMKNPKLLIPLILLAAVALWGCLIWLVTFVALVLKVLLVVGVVALFIAVATKIDRPRAFHELQPRRKR